MRTQARRKTRSSDPIPSDITMTLPELGIEIEKIKGDEGWCLCPGPHQARVGSVDRNPSWSINLDTGEHFCFSCGWGGPFIALVKFRMDDRDDEHARAWIRKHGGAETAIKRFRGEKAYTKKVAEEVTEANLALYEDPPAEARVSKDVCLESCQEYGVLWNPRTEQWIFPIREPFTGRLLGWQAKNKRKFDNYPPAVEKSETVFGHDALVRSGSDTAYLYESPVDAVRLHTYSIEGGVSSFGVHVSDTQMKILADTVDTLYVCLDNDGAGRSKEKEIWQEYRGMFRRMHFANYDRTDKKDHGEMTPEDVEWSLNNAINAVRYRP